MKKVVLPALASFLTLASAQVPIEFWHSMGGTNGEAVDALVEAFNGSQSEVVVRAEYVGTYEDSLQQLQLGVQTGEVPDLVQVYDVGTKIMADLAEAVPGTVVPLQGFLDREDDELSRASFVDNTATYYTVNGQLYSLPFNSSNPLFYYNADMWREAGLDPDNFPSTYEDLEAALGQIEAAFPDRFGMAGHLESWIFEQLLYNQGAYYCNGENGRAERATAVAWDSDEALELFTWWTGLIDNELNANVGRDVGAAHELFLSEQAAVTWASTASLRGLTDGAGDNFELRTAFVPVPEGAERNGVAVGGGSLWAMGGQPEAETEAAWTFIKYLLEPEQQATWHLATGYFPVVEAAFELPRVREAHAADPNFTTTIEQLEASRINNSSTGCLMGGFTQVRDILDSALEGVVNGESELEPAIADAAARSNEVIARFNTLVR